MIFKMLDTNVIQGERRKVVDRLASKCRSSKYLSRPTAQEALDLILEIIM